MKNIWYNEKMKALCAIFIVLLLASCSYYNPPLGSELTATPAASKAPEPTDVLIKPSLSPSPEASPSPAPEPTPFERKNVMNSPKILICKSERMLYVYDGDTLCAKITIALGSAPDGNKTKQGDGKTPEGTYYICTRNDLSKYYLALGISYPNIADAQAGLEGGLISQDEFDRIKKAIEDGTRPPWDTALGGEIMIHGSDTSSDWTAGCIATENEDMDYLWQNCPVGTPVEILP